jgi:tRNA A-37 threonylcarbamoyl transferase component Bud32
MAGAAEPTKAPGAGAGHEPPALADVVAAFPQFEIIELIGAGGMGTVWRARQPKLHREVALKLLPAAPAERDPAFAERFEREGQLLARLHHPNIVTVHDSGRAGDFYYLVMELVDGVNLRQAMRASRFTPAQALAIVPKICEALQYAHEEGVLHRDIKPENILLDAKGRVKLVDFGIAKLIAQTEGGGNCGMRNADCGVSEAAGALTWGDATLGTPNYMAPEQIDRPADVDHRADIYSLGVVFYELLTGELPVGKFAPPSQKSDADPRLDGIVQQALEKERSRRQQSVGEMRTQVETMAGTMGGADPAASSPAEPHTSSRFSRTAIWAALWVLVLPLGLGLNSLATSYNATLPLQGHARWWVGLPGLLLVAFGQLGFIGTPVLGWFAVAQIRRSAGQLRGLGLALIEGLLFPLLALDAVIFLAVGNFWRANPPQVEHPVGRWLAEYEFVIPLFALLVCLLVDWLIIRAVWRKVNPEPSGAAAPPPLARREDARPTIWPTALLHVLFMAAVCAALVLIVPTYLEIFGDFGIALPFPTRLVGNLSKALRGGGLVFLLCVALVDVGLCFLARAVGGRRGLRVWTAVVVVGWLLLAVVAGAALHIPLNTMLASSSAPAESHSASASVFFGPVIERVLPFDRSAIDFQKGTVLQPDWQKILSAGDEAYGRWLQENGADALVVESPNHAFGQPALDVTGYPKLTAPSRSPSEEKERCVFVMEEAAEFETVRPAEADAKLKIVSERKLSWTIAEGSRPWWFQTLDGAKGVVQLMGVNDQPRGLKIRYKLVVTDLDAAVSPTGSYRVAMLPKVQLTKSEAALQKLKSEAAAQDKIAALEAELQRGSAEWSKFEAVLARHKASGVSQGEWRKAQNAMGTAEVRLRVAQAIAEDSTAGAVFGPAFEQFIPANDEAPWPWFDIDTGRMIFTFGDEERVEDFYAGMVAGHRGLYTAEETGFGTMALEAAQWETMTSGALVEKLKAATVDGASAEGSGPQTYAFTTRSGGLGVLQILSAGDHPRGLQIRYKLLEPGPKPPSVALSIAGPAVGVSQTQMKGWVEKRLATEYPHDTYRSLEWGEPEAVEPQGWVTIRYKYHVSFGDRPTKYYLGHRRYTFTKTGEFVRSDFVDGLEVEVPAPKDLEHASAPPAAPTEKYVVTKEQAVRIEALLSKGPVTTELLAALFEHDETSGSSYRRRADVTAIPVLPAEKSPLDFVPLGEVLSRAGAGSFYIQWDAMGASTHHYYGPFLSNSEVAAALGPRKKAE